MYAFFDCNNLTSITIPESMMYVGSNAFNGCSSLSHFYVAAVNPPECNIFTFEDFTTSACTLVVPAGTVDTYQKAEEWGNFGVITDNITTTVEKTTAVPFVSAYPNPVKDNLYVKSDVPVEKVEAYNSLGVCVLVKDNIAGSLDVSALPDGIYLFRIYVEGAAVMQKVVMKE